MATDRTPFEVVKYLRDFIDGTGTDWDWDDFTSPKIKDVRLEAIRSDANLIALPVTPQGMEKLRELLARAEALL